MKSVLLIALLLAGCAGAYDPSRVVVMQNPETRQTVECRIDQWGSLNKSRQIDHCVRAYAQAGYVQVGDSIQ